MSRIGQRWRARNRRFARDESGQVMLLTAMLSLVLIALPASLVNVGQAIAVKIRLQTAADAASLAATTWMARGSNLLQGLNGMHWDFNVFMADAIIASALEADSEIAATKNPITAAQIWWRENRLIPRMESAQSAGARTIETVSTTVCNLTPYLAFFYANTIAGQNGADLLDLGGFPVLGPVFKDLQKIIKPVQDVASIRTWTLNPSFWPPTALGFGHKRSAPSNYTTPYYTTSWNPFLICIEFARTPSWHDNYWESDHVDETVTCVVSTDRRTGYMLDRLLQHAGTVPNAYALASSKMTGDKLYAAGQEKTTYMCIPNACVSINPPVSGIPWRWTGIGSYHYGGDFKSQPVPVVVSGQKGSSFLIYH